MERKDSIVVEAQMLIRRPVAQVFEAFVDPQVTTRFWFTKSSGRLEPGEKVRWDWEMFGVGDDLTVKEFEENQRILVFSGTVIQLLSNGDLNPVKTVQLW